jgi:hypothetical protein
MTHDDFPTESELADDVPDEVEAKGKPYKRDQSGAVQYYALAGPVIIVRDTKVNMHAKCNDQR